MMIEQILNALKELIHITKQAYEAHANTLHNQRALDEKIDDMMQLLIDLKKDGPTDIIYQINPTEGINSLGGEQQTPHE